MAGRSRFAVGRRPTTRRAPCRSSPSSNGPRRARTCGPSTRASPTSSTEAVRSRARRMGRRPPRARRRRDRGRRWPRRRRVGGPSAHGRLDAEGHAADPGPSGATGARPGDVQRGHRGARPRLSAARGAAFMRSAAPPPRRLRRSRRRRARRERAAGTARRARAAPRGRRRAARPRRTPRASGGRCAEQRQHREVDRDLAGRRAGARLHEDLRGAGELGGISVVQVAAGDAAQPEHVAVERAGERGAARRRSRGPRARRG